MRFVGIFFSVYLLILSLLPCNDKVEEYSVAAYISISADQNHEHENDLSCTSVCVCSCCHIALTNYAFAKIEIGREPVPEENGHYQLFNQQLISRYHNQIWQPPRLG